jgi:hypothetical protein
MEMPPVTLAPLLPMVSPLIVTTKGEVPMVAIDVVKTNDEELVLLHATTRYATLTASAWTKGLDGAKKFEG